MPTKAIIIGAGNVAWHLSQALDKAGIVIDQIITRHVATAKPLAEKFGAYYGTTPVVGSSADLIFICTSDDEIANAAQMIQYNGGIVVHTSGSIHIDVLQHAAKQYGVFYPLQTFSKERKADFLHIPILIEASDNSTENTLKHLAEQLSNQVLFANSAQRKTLHLAAVITNNFTNHLLQMAEEITALTELPFSVLHPLMRETLDKAIVLGAKNAQTGPAKRGDQQVIETHIAWLKKVKPEMAPVYEILSKAIHASHT